MRYDLGWVVQGVICQGFAVIVLSLLMLQSTVIIFFVVFGGKLALEAAWPLILSRLFALLDVAHLDWVPLGGEGNGGHSLLKALRRAYVAR